MAEVIEQLKKYTETHGSEGLIRLSELYVTPSACKYEPECAEFMKISACQNVYSVAKTFTMTALGLLYDRGLLSPDEKVCDILRESGVRLPADMDRRWESVTVDLALSHSIGLPGGFLDIDVNPAGAFGEDFLGYMLSHPMSYTPGEKSVYTDGAFYLLARVAEAKIPVKQGSPGGMDSFLWSELMYPLGCREMAWSRCPMGHVIGATGLYIHTDDMARLGALFCKAPFECTNGKPLLSREWTSLAIERGYALDWDKSGRFFSKGGMYGQQLIMVPSQNRVVALQSFGGSWANVVREIILGI
ncbi:MAG: beta-lactamase family protein [Clostridiales bacterium]|nr:beta-lactamase family protein [Clostridiales bacterium]